MRTLLFFLVLVSGCGTLLEAPLPDAGRPCNQDSDCVPNGCCGEATSAIHVSDAPNCSTVRCTTMCPVNQIRCGCGLPLCRDSRCTVAVAVDPRCG